MIGLYGRLAKIMLLIDEISPYDDDIHNAIRLRYEEVKQELNDIITEVTARIKDIEKYEQSKYYKESVKKELMLLLEGEK